MNLNQLRLKYLQSDHQFIIVDDQFMIVESCNSLVDFSDLYQTSLFDSIPFLESFAEELNEMKEGNQLFYECINMSLLNRHSVYDFSFEQIDGALVLIVLDGEKKYASLKKLQQERNESVIRKEVKEKEARLKSSFLANMSHEIRTPMNIVIGYTNLLLAAKDLQKENRTFVNNISLAAKDLLVLINDILDLSKIEAGYLSIEIIPFNLKKLIDNLQQIFSEQCRDKAIDFSIHYDPQLPENIQSDSVRVNQIITNLLSNAIKFSNTGDKVTLQVKKDPKKDILIFEVSDTGIGIDEGKLDKIFDNFTQEEDATTRNFGGTGLGLSIVKKLSNLLNGAITVKSKKGYGSTFTLQLPLIYVNNNSQVNDNETKGSFDVSFLVGKQLLVAEDNKMNQILITKILEDAGCILTLATNGEEAVEFADSRKFDAILMDVQMPVLDGLDATKKIIAQSKLNSRTPVIAMTAHSFKEDIDKCYSAGMINYVSKPFDLDHLMTVLITEIQKSKNKSIVGPTAIETNNIPTEGSVKAKIDLSFLKQLGGDNSDFIKEFLQVYEEEISASLLKMQLPIQQGQVMDIKAVVHNIKPTLEMIGFLDIKKQIVEFEQGEMTTVTANKLISSIKPVIEDSLNTVKNMLAAKDFVY